VKSFEGINQIVMYDYQNRYEDKSNINLGISSDYNMHLDEKYFNDDREDYDQHNGILSLTHYSGRIYVPKFTSIEILDTERTITGIIASPAHISTYGNVDLIIDRKSGLDLCVENYMRTMINGIKCYGRDEVEQEQQLRKILPLIGDNIFEELYEEYLDYIYFDSPKPQIMQSKYGKYTDHHESKIDIQIIDVCRHHGMIYINKDCGYTKLKFKQPTSNDLGERTQEMLKYHEYLNSMYSKEENIYEYFNYQIKNAKTPEQKIKISNELGDKIQEMLGDKKEDYENLAKLRDIKNKLDISLNSKS